MPQIESQKKRVITSRKSQTTNRREKSTLKNTMKRFEVAIESGNKDEAKVLFDLSNQLLDKSITSNIHHPNYVNRKRSVLANKMNRLK